jgi:hypothetical protein
MPADLKPPKGLSPRLQDLWRRLHAENTFSPDAEDLLERYLRNLALADELTARARETGLTSADGHRALAAARDCMQTALKILKATGLDKAAEAAPRRPGRPAGEDWSPERKAGAAGFRALMSKGSA